MTLVLVRTSQAPSPRLPITSLSMVTEIRSNQRKSGEAKRGPKPSTMTSCAMHTKFSVQILIHRKVDQVLMLQYSIFFFA